MHRFTSLTATDQSGNRGSHGGQPEPSSINGHGFAGHIGAGFTRHYGSVRLRLGGGEKSHTPNRTFGIADRSLMGRQ